MPPRTYYMGGSSSEEKFICKKNCRDQFASECQWYDFLEGETYVYNYARGRNGAIIYHDGKYNGFVKQSFIDENFYSESEYNDELKTIDQWFDELLHSNYRILKIKKLNEHSY